MWKIKRECKKLTKYWNAMWENDERLLGKNNGSEKTGKAGGKKVKWI